MDYELGYTVERQIADGTTDYWAGLARRWSPDIWDARILDPYAARQFAELCRYTLERVEGASTSRYATFHAKRVWRPIRASVQH